MPQGHQVLPEQLVKLEYRVHKVLLDPQDRQALRDVQDPQGKLDLKVKLVALVALVLPVLQALKVQTAELVLQDRRAHKVQLD